MKVYKDESLILVAEDGNTTSHIVPDSSKRTIAWAGYKLLIEKPYIYTEKEYHSKVHYDILNKRKTLKLDSYDIRRSALVQKYGWGVHIKDGKLALVKVDSNKYQRLVSDDSITKVKAWRLKKLLKNNL